MHSEKFIEFTKPFVKKSIVFVVSASIAACHQQHQDIHQDSPVFPSNPYGVRAVETGTSSGLGTGTGNETKRGLNE